MSFELLKLFSLKDFFIIVFIFFKMKKSAQNFGFRNTISILILNFPIKRKIYSLLGYQTTEYKVYSGHGYWERERIIHILFIRLRKTEITKF